MAKKFHATLYLYLCRDVHPCYMVRVVHSRDVSPYIFDGPAMSGLAFSVAPLLAICASQSEAPDGRDYSLGRMFTVSSVKQFRLI